MATQSMGGLVNMGMTCYANAVFQSIRHCPKIPWMNSQSLILSVGQGSLAQLEFKLI